MFCVVAPVDHKYVPPPIDGVAVSVVDCPLQIVAELTLTVGTAFTVTAFVDVAEHPPRL